MSDAELVDSWNLVVAVVHGTHQNLMTDLTDRTGIPSAWFEVLVRLRDAADHRLPMSTLSGDVAMTSGGFTKLADRLEEAGYLRRRPSDDDRRVVFLELTGEGRRAAEKALRVHVDNLRERVLTGMPCDGMRDLRESLQVLRPSADLT